MLAPRFYQLAWSKDSRENAGISPRRANPRSDRAKKIIDWANETSGRANETSGQANETPGQANETSGQANETSGQTSKTSGRAKISAKQAGNCPDGASQTSIILAVQVDREARGDQRLRPMSAPILLGSFPRISFACKSG
ncbi:MAG TPA: hypothetical protein VF432_02820 [Thermoanaerobaculia bacterium]